MSAKKADNDFVVAAGALDELPGKQYALSKLKLPQLRSLVHVLGCIDKKCFSGNKSEAIRLLEGKFGSISEEQFESLRVTVLRGVARAALPAPPERLAIAETAPPPAPALVDASPCLALSRPRRN